MQGWRTQSRRRRSSLRFLFPVLVSLCFCTPLWAQSLLEAKNLSATPGRSQRPQLAVDAGGTVHVVWADLTPGNFDIYYMQSRDAGATFTPLRNLSNSPGASTLPQLSVDARGDVYIAWWEIPAGEGNSQVFFTRSRDGGATFSAPKNIPATFGSSFLARLVVDSHGWINVVWVENTADRQDIFFTQSRDAGESFAPPRNLSGSTGWNFLPQLAVDAKGNITVVWVNTGAEHQGIWLTHSDDAGASFAAPRNLCPQARRATQPCLAVDANGNIHMAWRDMSADRSQVFYARSTDAGKTFSAPQGVSATLLGPCVHPHLAVDAQGNVYLVWQQCPGTKPEIWFSYSRDSGASFSQPHNLSGTRGTSRIFAHWAPLVATPAGNVSVVWMDDTGGQFDILFTHSDDAGQSFCPPLNVSQSRGASKFAWVAMDAEGTSYVVWQDDSWGQGDIMFARLITQSSRPSAPVLGRR